MPSHQSNTSRVLWGLLAYALAFAVISGFWYFVGHPHFVKEPALSEDHKLQCVSYAPFEKDQTPYDIDRGMLISNGRIDTDLAILSKRFGCIRTYSSTGFEAVPEYAKKYGLKVMLGAWVSADPLATQRELGKVVALARKYPEIVRAVVVGNEALLRKEVTGQQLADYLRQVKRELPGVPITYADVWEFWLKYPEVAPATDFITIHILPYWEDEPAGIETAIAHVRNIRIEVNGKIPGKDILIGETGWPSEGRMREDALPSRENQARFMRGFVQLAEAEGWQYNLIEAFDQPWKRINEGAVGGYWGLYDQDRNDKGVFSGPITNYPDWKTLLLQSLVIAALTLVLLRRHGAITPSRWLTLSLAVAAGAVLIVLQGHQFAVITRSSLEFGWAVLILALAVSSYFALVHSVASNRHIVLPAFVSTYKVFTRKTPMHLESFSGLLRIASVVCALVTVTGFVFDARYRSFPTFGFALPALYFLWICLSFRGGNPQQRESDRSVEKACAIFFIFGAVFIAGNETLYNWQSNLWVLVCLLFAYPLWMESRESGFPDMKAIVATAVVAYAGVWGIRYGVMESVELVGVCTDNPAKGICQVRSTFGLLIHFQVIGWLSLLALLAALLTRKKTLAISALALSIAGLTLYNAGLSSFAFVLALMAIVMIDQIKTRKATPVN